MIVTGTLYNNMISHKRTQQSHQKMNNKGRVTGFGWWATGAGAFRHMKTA